MIVQLDPPLPMDTVRGAGLAHFMIDYGPEAHLMWVVFMDADGACWTVPNPEVRMQPNWSMQRRPGRKPFERPSPVAVPITLPPSPDPSHAALNGHVGPNGMALNGTSLNGTSLNGVGVNGTALNGHGAVGGGAQRYDAAPG